MSLLQGGVFSIAATGRRQQPCAYITLGAFINSLLLYHFDADIFLLSMLQKCHNCRVKLA